MALPRRATLDAEFLRLTLSGEPRAEREAKLAALRARSRLLAEGRGPCPECGDEGPHEDNGETRPSLLAFCCRACGMHFDFEQV